MNAPRVPNHVAIVMDGNGRWATKRFLPRIAGHKQGVEALRRCLRLCDTRGIRVLTVFAFSSENWQRPPDEVTGLMDLFAFSLSRELPQLMAEGVQLHFIGERQGLSKRVLQGIEHVETQTSQNTRLIFNICFNYGGRWDIAQAAAKVIERGEPMTEQNLDRCMALSHVADPDLVIRTGGEQRISNFLLWQSAYSEFVFAETLWPDFDEIALDFALATYASRERRFGKTPDQLRSSDQPAIKG
jgi:undecaprenyl diphosphate synthase